MTEAGAQEGEGRASVSPGRTWPVSLWVRPRPGGGAQVVEDPLDHFDVRVGVGDLAPYGGELDRAQFVGRVGVEFGVVGLCRDGSGRRQGVADEGTGLVGC